MEKSLPTELIHEIISFALRNNPHPTSILSVSSTFYKIGVRTLYAVLHFRSVRQLLLFSEFPGRIAFPPREIRVTLAGGTADFEVFNYLAAVFRRCASEPPSESGAGPKKGLTSTAAPLVSLKLELDLLSLCLHSHVRDPNLKQIYDALVLVNPKIFMWVGPDPDHHFSTAIVSTATSYVFQAIATWSAIEHIKLSNLSFPLSDILGVYGPFANNTPLLPALPSLKTLYLGQATLLPPSAVAAMVCMSGQDNLELVRLVDCYGESIWGSRIRRRDVEKAAKGLKEVAKGAQAEEALLEKIRRIVICEARTERIMGGDRVEGITVLE